MAFSIVSAILFTGKADAFGVCRGLDISAEVSNKMRKICMVIPDPMVKGGIAAVVNGYRGSRLEKDYRIIYVESYTDGGKIKKLLKGIAGYFHFAKVLLMDKPELVHIHSSFGPSFYRKIPFIYMASWAGLPVINHIHGSEFAKFYTNAGAGKQKLVKKVWGKCTRFIVLSSEWKKVFSVVIPEEKMTVVENYSILAPVVNRENKESILFLGAINRMKGCYDIVEVIAEVRKRIPDVKMVMCGDGEVRRVKEKARACGVLDCFEFPGWVRGEEKDRILRNANVFFLPSYSEGMPMSVLDAMGYGLPIIASKVGGIPKIVRENGSMCAPGDIRGFSGQLYISEELTIPHGQSDHLSRRFRSLISERDSR